MKKYILILLPILILVFIILQFIKPDTKNPIEDNNKFITSHLSMPDNVYKQMEKSCFDCHSDRTKWPWYSNISPVVYLIKNDVDEGKEHLNFSIWGDYDKSRKMDKLDGIETQVKDEEMPKSIYLPMHPEAKLSESDKEMIIEWARSSKDQLFKE